MRQPSAPARPPLASGFAKAASLDPAGGVAGLAGWHGCGRSGLVWLAHPPSLVARCSAHCAAPAGVRVWEHSFGQPSPSGSVLAVAPSIGGKGCGRSPAVSSALSRLPAPPSSASQSSPALSRPQLRSGLPASPAPPSSPLPPSQASHLEPPAGEAALLRPPLQGGRASVSGWRNHYSIAFNNQIVRLNNSIVRGCHFVRPLAV